MWAPVVRKLRLAAAFFVAHWDVSAAWSPEVSIFDASPLGGAVVTTVAPLDMVKHDSRLNDRWRSSGGTSKSTRRLRLADTYRGNLDLATQTGSEKRKWTRDAPQAVREEWRALLTDSHVANDSSLLGRINLRSCVIHSGCVPMTS